MHRSALYGLRAIPLALFCAFPPLPAFADNTLGETIVTANRRETSVDSMTTTVTSINREQLDRALPIDDADLFRDETDVVMARDLRRHGATRVNIRGMEDNRVVSTIDGVRMSDHLDFGGPTNYTSSAPIGVMPDFLRRVEIVRGPASSLYGSDALGGLVGYLTLNPEDIARHGAAFGARAKASYSSANRGFTGTLIGAWRGEVADFLFGYSQGASKETENMGSNGSRHSSVNGNHNSNTRSKPNHLDNDDKGAIAKLVLRPASGHRVTTTVEGRQTQTDADILLIPYGLRRVETMSGNDESRRLRGSIEYEHKPANAFYDRLAARLSHQRSTTENDNFQQRSNTSFSGLSGCSATGVGANTCDIWQVFEFAQTDTAVNVQLDSSFSVGASTHILSYGFDLMRQSVATERNNYALRAGIKVPNPGGDADTVHDFPDGKTDKLGVFIQDEIGLFANRLTLTPGIRYDRTKLKPDNDADWKGVGQPPGATWSHVSPKLGVQWQVDPMLSAYGQIAGGFRAPNYKDVNYAFFNQAQSYAVASNPDLKPETSVGVELGVRGRTARASFQFSVYDNRYKDFISLESLDCPTNPACVAGAAFGTSQYQNLAKVRIYGADLRGAYRLTEQWQIDGSLSYARGKDEDTNAGLTSIEPLRASLGVQYTVGDWGAEGRLRLAKAKSRSSLGNTTTQYYRPAGYGVTDLTAWYRLSRNTRIVGSVNNLFDKKYWLWGDTRHVGLTTAATDTNPDFFTQPGRNFRLSLQADF
ncbi:hemoglobin/transferrin/lactoferrin receptor protein [Azonexus fungiphilus]|uniref:Hemoglobin/transferrin/lactoferrin receptor protein n=1 Tax=Azonexus fungiphilus TaxID=146940 RepID=A0A495WC57_9RHOO|nr:TonB-dependent hemoglobin/transferrin/lactoferrin family receptor [Azonexus fungiphilus]RKT59241.1 hemoglobin/transferrin/lactoferrin receptor protein [Azonexus fungiphilus]